MNDLFILGAGASVPYDFPSGEKLFEEIKKINYHSLQDENLRNGCFKYFGDQNTYNMLAIMQEMYNFSVDIKNSSMLSIDDFLRNRKSNKIQNKFGKMIIVDKILNAERKYKTDIELKSKKDWFTYLLSYIDRDENLFNDFFNNSKFITFNYDRLLEYKIFEYLHYDKKYKEDEISKKIKEINIIHVNGSIGNLKDIEFGKSKEVRKNQMGRNYDVHPNYEFIIETMKTIWEHDDKEKEQKQKEIMEYFKTSERIFFIGFGWLEDNIKILGIRDSNILEGKEIYVSAYGLSEKREKEISTLLNYKMNTGNVKGLKAKISRDYDAKKLIMDFFN